MSIDGYIDDGTPSRLLLSNDADFDRVDAVRATCDAILVGANTIRRDNPRLLVRSETCEQPPIKVTLSATGNFDPSSRFFTAGSGMKIVYAASAVVDKLGSRLGDTALVVDAGEPVSLDRVLADLANRGVRRLLVEGGGAVHTQFLRQDLADELQLVIAPFFVGDPAAPRFVHDGHFPQNPERRMVLAGVQQIGDVVLLRYLPS
jgi:5-amino-6-(5-phosphoribosylamino)uracil reductase